MGTQSSFGLVRYNLEFSIEYPKTCRQKNNKDYQHYRSYYRSRFCLDDYCREELNFWKDNLINLNSRNCFVSKDPSYFVYSDANATGGGAFIDFNNDFVCHKVWTENESLQSSTWRELSVIEFSLQSFATLLEGSHVKWYTDSQAAAKVVEVGSIKFDLHRVARSIFSICMQLSIHLEVQWIPRSLNQQADYISHLRADVSKYRPEAYKSEKLKNPKKIHRVALVELLSEIYFLFRFDDYY